MILRTAGDKQFPLRLKRKHGEMDIFQGILLKAPFKKADNNNQLFGLVFWLFSFVSSQTDLKRPGKVQSKEVRTAKPK